MIKLNEGDDIMSKERAIKINLGIAIILFIGMTWFTSESTILLDNNIVAGVVYSTKIYGIGDYILSIMFGLGLLLQLNKLLKYLWSYIEVK